MNYLRRVLPPLTALAPFEAAARLESFTKAAEELGLTQAAISRQIRALEQDLRTPLFERRNRAVRLTEAGRAFARVVSAGLESVAAHAEQLRASRDKDEVVFFCQLCEAMHWATARLSAFEHRHPGIRIRLAASSRPVTEFDGPFDVALQTATRATGANPIVFTAPEEVYPLCSPSYLAGRTPPLALDTLPEHRLLHHIAEPQDWLEWDDWLERVGHPLRVGHKGVVYDSYPVLVQSALEGRGLFIGWTRTSQALVASGALVRPFRESVTLAEGLAVCRRAGPPPRPEAQALIDWLRAELIG